MSALHGSSVVYVDFENVIANTDFFVCKKIYQLLKNDKEAVKNNILHNFFDIINQLGEDYILSFCNTKKNINPFFEIADLSVLTEQELAPFKEAGLSNEEINVFLCSQMYYEVLNHEYTFDYMDDFSYTNVADSLKVLLKDTQLQKIYIYVDTMTNFIHKSLYNKFNNSDKVVIVTGDKFKFLSETRCDTYMVQNVYDIRFLSKNFKETDNKSSFIFLDYNYNQVAWDKAFSDENHSSHTIIENELHINVNMMKVTI